MYVLRALRKKKGLSMKEFGSIFGLGESTISQYETGKRQVTPDLLLKFSSFFNVSVDYLLGREDAQKKASSDDEALKEFLAEHPDMSELVSALLKLDDEHYASIKNYLDFILAQQKYDSSK